MLSSQGVFIANIRLQPRVPAVWCFICFSCSWSSHFAVSFPRDGWVGSGAQADRGVGAGRDPEVRRTQPKVTLPCFWPVSAQNQGVSAFIPSLPYQKADWYPALLQSLLVVIQGFGCFIKAFSSKVNINYTVGRLSLSVSCYFLFMIKQCEKEACKPRGG